MGARDPKSLASRWLKKDLRNERENQMSICVLCNQEVRNCEHISGTELYHLECDTCGRYVSGSFNDLGLKAMSPEDRAMLSAYTREFYEHGADETELHNLDEQQTERILENYRIKSLDDKLNNFIQYIAKKTTYFGEEIEIDSRKDYPITYSKNIDEFENVFFLTKKLGFIECNSDKSDEQDIKLSALGWAKSKEINKSGIQSKKCFIAMSCSDELAEIYENGIKKAVDEAGFQPIFIEREEHNEKICDLIIAKIRECKFLIADVTGQRQNVYYEAGFAQGLNRDVIWMCRQNEIDSAHFDTRQYNHIAWENAEDLKKKLLNRIKATIL